MDTNTSHRLAADIESAFSTRRKGLSAAALRFLAGALGLIAASPLPAATTQPSAPAPVRRGPNGDRIENDDPEGERQTFKVADGFEVNLFAGDSMAQKPIQMNFGPDGRLWVASSETYPQVKPGQTPNDKVIVLEDTTGSGRADKSTVFAEGLFLPNAVLPGDGGVYVTNSTEILHLKDTTGSGKADQRRVVLTGFGTEDTHHIIHTLRWGPDGRFYFNQSIYISSHVETPHGTKHLLAGGVWRYRPETMELNVLVTGLINPWGDVWDRWGNAFGTDGAGGEGINYFLPGAAFTATPGAVRVLKGLNPGSPKYCGEEILSGRHLPDDVQGDILTNDFRANRIVRFKVSDDGAGFSSKLVSDFISSTDRAFRPIDIKMGPDGAIYIADWYNPIIQHGEVDFRDPRRDHSHGRIWRVTAKNRPLLPQRRFDKLSTADLLNCLLDPEGYSRQQAKNVLRERDAREVAAALPQFLASVDQRSADLGPDGVEHARLEALWTYECIDTPEPTLLTRLLNSPDPRARSAACRVVAHWASHLESAAELVAPKVADENPRVRLEAVRALSDIALQSGRPELLPLAMKALDHPIDPFLDYALYKTCIDLQPLWMPAFKAGKLSSWADPRHLTYALQAVKSPEAIATLLAQLRDGKLPTESHRDVLELIASVGTAADLSTLLDVTALSDKADDASKAAAMNAVERAARRRRTAPTKVPADRLKALIASPNDDVAAAAVRLLGILHVDAARAEIERAATAAQTRLGVRLAAVQALAEVGRGPSRRPQSSTRWSPPAMRRIFGPPASSG